MSHCRVKGCLWEAHVRSVFANFGLPKSLPDYNMATDLRADRPTKVRLAWDGEEEAHITVPPPRARTGTQRRNLCWHNRGRTSSGRSDELKSPVERGSLCWWTCSGPDRDPEKQQGNFVCRSQEHLVKSSTKSNAVISHLVLLLSYCRILNFMTVQHKKKVKFKKLRSTFPQRALKMLPTDVQNVLIW